MRSTTGSRGADAHRHLTSDLKKKEQIYSALPLQSVRHSYSGLFFLFRAQIIGGSNGTYPVQERTWVLMFKTSHIPLKDLAQSCYTACYNKHLSNE